MQRALKILEKFKIYRIALHRKPVAHATPSPASPPTLSSKYDHVKELSLLRDRKKVKDTHTLVPFVVENDVHPSHAFSSMKVCSPHKGSSCDLHFHILMLFVASSSPLGA